MNGNEPTYSVSWMMLIRSTKGIKEGHAKIYEEIYGGGFSLWVIRWSIYTTNESMCLRC